MTITVVGGGLAGLIAAIECGEGGVDVELFEAQSLLGGRARSTTGDFTANHGPHVVYDDGPLWRWLDERGMAEPAGHAPKGPNAVRFVRDGRARRVPPKEAAAAFRLARREAPDDVSFADWVTAERDAATAAAVSSLCHIFTFHHDPGSLAASFIVERLRRALSFPPRARYVQGGWGGLVARLEARARALGVRITTGHRVDELPRSPVILALELGAARRLLGDESLRWSGTRTACLDVGLTTARETFLVLDLDRGVAAERFSLPDPTLAPRGHQLWQAQVGLRDGESLDDGIRAIEAAFDAALPAWREREVWRRRQVVTDATGAVDLPGTTWRDRPAIDRGDGVFLCGDMVAAPGLLAEVACVSAIEAARSASQWGAASARSRSGSPPRSTVA